MNNKKNTLIYILCTILVLAVVLLAFSKTPAVKLDGSFNENETNAPQSFAQTTAATTQPIVSTSSQSSGTSAEPSNNSGTNALASTNEQVIKKYTMLVDKFKQEKPAYKRKEYQAMPDEYKNFGSAVNMVLGIASAYMTTEDQAEEVIREKGCAEITEQDMPIHYSDKGCLLTNYDAVAWSKDEDLGDGTNKISFSLKEEINAEPTPAETLVPLSNHGAVMQPLSRKTIMTEIDNVTSKVPGLEVSTFDLNYNSCVFECIYDPATNQAKSITHHIVIDITAEARLFISSASGSVRLLNEMLIYDITW